jgi:hypothetical protein
VFKDCIIRAKYGENALTEKIYSNCTKQQACKAQQAFAEKK